MFGVFLTPHKKITIRDVEYETLSTRTLLFRLLLTIEAGNIVR